MYENGLVAKYRISLIMFWSVIVQALNIRRRRQENTV